MVDALSVSVVTSVAIVSVVSIGAASAVAAVSCSGTSGHVAGGRHGDKRRHQRSLLVDVAAIRHADM